MPLDRFVLMLFIVLIAAGVTVWLGAVIAASFTLPFGVVALLPAALVGYVAWRVIAERLRNADDDHYDKM
jgi:membrane protein implicated in regulation of membrane protease activity